MAGLVHVLIRFYQLTISGIVGRHCRYLPTCSEYADEAIRRHGLWVGGQMSAARLCRCHPWGGHGFDPVPQARSAGTLEWQGWRRAFGFTSEVGTDARKRAEAQERATSAADKA